ncbi:MAG: hypothetical protein ACLPID_03335 [Beijerinckiaceae bacterium]
MNVIDSNKLERDMQISLRNLRRLDCAGKPVPNFPHPALGCVVQPCGQWVGYRSPREEAQAKRAMRQQNQRNIRDPEGRSQQFRMS